jgi:divalent metal cation (Fe/Co/Zn/Cd) transporter
VMFWLAHRKLALNASIGSSAVRADAAISSSCGAMALIAAVCVTSQLSWNLCWVDSVGCLLIAMLLAREATLVWSGKGCSCTHSHAHA